MFFNKLTFFEDINETYCLKIENLEMELSKQNKDKI